MEQEFSVFSPFDRHVLTRLSYTPRSAIDGMFAKAETARANPLSKLRRIEILEKAERIARTHAEDFARLIAEEGGKPIIDARIEVERGLSGIRLAAETLRSQTGHCIPMGNTASSEGRLAFTMLEPIGVVVAISAFNHPFNLIVHQAIPAIAAGNPVIVKPSLRVPLTCLKLVAMLREAGLPSEWCQVALLDDAGAEALATDPRVAFLTFIGSAKVGWHLRSKLAPGARCSLELGGAAPVIVERDADVAAIAAPLAKAAFYHAGQVCVSAQRIFAHWSIRDKLAEAIAAEGRKLKVGDPLDEETGVGPLIVPSEVERVGKWVAESVASGAKVLSGGKALGETCFEPTLLLEPGADAKVSTQEIFGPVACVYGYEKLDEAVARANALPFSFQAAVFTQNIDVALAAAKGLNAAAVMINDHTAFRVDWMPFGGRKVSGLGVGGIPYAMAEMSEEKLVVIKSKELE